MLEIEQKFPVPSFDAIRAKLEDWQATPGELRREADQYFRPPDRDFAQTDEAVRLRQLGPRNVATYKGPRQSGPIKTRLEIEVPIADGPEAAAAFARFLGCLRYQPVATVRKERLPYQIEKDGFHLEICLDEVADVGRFVEVEIVCPPEQQARAEQVLQQVTAGLGLTKPEWRSYLEMYLTGRG